MIVDYEKTLYRDIRFAYAEFIDDMREKYGDEWFEKAKVTKENRASIERLTESRVLEMIADPMEEEKADPVVAKCDAIIRLTLLPEVLKKHFDMLESEGRLL